MLLTSVLFMVMNTSINQFQISKKFHFRTLTFRFNMLRNKMNTQERKQEGKKLSMLNHFKEH